MQMQWPKKFEIKPLPTQQSTPILISGSITSAFFCSASIIPSKAGIAQDVMQAPLDLPRITQKIPPSRYFDFQTCLAGTTWYSVSHPTYHRPIFCSNDSCIAAWGTQEGFCVERGRKLMNMFKEIGGGFCLVVPLLKVIYSKCRGEIEIPICDVPSWGFVMSCSGNSN